MLQTASWGIVSSLILVPHIFFLQWIYEISPQTGSSSFMVLLSLWFLFNYFYIRRLQPAIDRRFNRYRNHLNREVKAFIANAVFLKDIGELELEFQDLMKRCLAIPQATVFLSRGTSSEMGDPMSGETLSISDNVLKVFESLPFSVGVDMETHPMYAEVAPELLELMIGNGFRYMLPLVQAKQLVGLVLLPRPDHGADLSPDELKLLDRLSAAGLAFSNSAIYKKIADLKANLEKRTAELTIEVEERQRIEEVLRKSEEKHRLMAENIKDVIWTMEMASSREVTNLNRLVSDHLASAEHANLLSHYLKARVDVEFEDDLWNISCSRIHIEKVLMNLLGNAMEALDPSGVVTVSTKNCIVDRPIRGYDTVNTGEYTVLSVSDTGSGIPPLAISKTRLLTSSCWIC